MAAPPSFARRYRGQVCIYWAVLEWDGFVVLPVPKWYKQHKWKRYVPVTCHTASENGSRGMAYTKYKIEERSFYDYLNAVLIDLVTEYLTEKKRLHDFNLRSSRG